MTINTISTLPTAPARTDAPATFISRADAFLAALVVMQGQLNTSIGQMNTDIAQVNADAISAAASATAAANASNASAWVSGTTYALADVVYSPIDYQSYRRIIAGAGTTDPSSDATNWTKISAEPLPSQSGQSGKYLSTNGTVPSWETLTTDPTLGTLTKTFANGESASINLTSSVLAPVVSVTKEVPQSGVTNNSWDVNSTTENYTRLDSAYATTLSFTGGGSPFVLGTGSFASADVGKTIEANSGEFVLTATDGSYVETTAPTSYAQVASGSWSMYGVVYNATDGDLELSGVTDPATAFDVSTASFTISFSVSAQETSPYGVAFSTDGTKMFVAGDSGNDINEYALSTGFDVSTASFTYAYSVAAQESQPSDVNFNTDGTKMFVVGTSGRDVNEYTLTTGFDLQSTVTFVDSFPIAGGEADGTGLAFSTNGTKMFVVGRGLDTVQEFSLSTGFDVSTSTFVDSFSVAPQDVSPVGLAFNTNGTKMYITGQTGDAVYEYTLSTGFDVSTSSFTQSFSVAGQDTAPRGLAFNTNGTKMFVVGGTGNDINEYSIGTTAAPTGYQPVHTTASIDSTYWTDINSMTADQNAGDGNVYYAISTDDRTTWTVIDNTDGERDIVRNNAGTWQYNSNGTYALETWVNGATNTELATLAEAMEGAAVGYGIANGTYLQSFSVASQNTVPFGLAFSSDGTKMFFANNIDQTVGEYVLSTAFDVSTASFVDAFSIAAQESAPRGLAFSSDGTKMFVTGAVGVDVTAYSLSTAFDVSTSSFDTSFSVSAQDTSPRGITFNPDGTKMFVVGAVGDDVNEYTLSTGFDISTASFVDSFSVSAQDTSPEMVAFNSNGTKMFLIANAGDNVYEYNLSTGFDVSTASYSSISFSVAAQEGIALGIAFNSDGTKMFVSGSGTDSVYEYSTASYPNQMDKTQLDAVTDPNHIALGNDLDLAIVFNMTSGTTVPSSDGVAINYDANVLNKGAVLGTDYDFDAPTQNSVRITALAANNLKVRVV